MQIFQLTKLLSTHFNIASTKIKQLVGEQDLNYYIQSSNGKSYILKIAAKDEVEKKLLLQNAAMLHLATKKLDFELPRIIPKSRRRKYNLDYR